MFRTRFSLGDCAILAFLLLLTLLTFLFPLLRRETGTQVLITTPDGMQRYTLSENREITLSSGEHTLTVEILDGKVRVKESTCPDHICVSGGWISRTGQSVLCAPAGVRLLITGKGGGQDADFIAG